MIGSNSELMQVGNAFSQQSLASLSGSTQRQTAKEMEHVVGRTLVTEVYEQGRAVLTNTALNNVGALSALEQHLISVAPLGEARYKHIVDAYALGAAQTIARW